MTVRPLDEVWPYAERLGWARGSFEGALAPFLSAAELDLEGLTLAGACLAHLPLALQALDTELLPAVRTSLSRRASAAVVDDVLQQARIKLLFGEPPAFAQYRGRGPLQGFVRTVAVHLLANQQARDKATESDDVLAAEPAAAEVEAGLIRADQQQHFQAAFREAVARLTARQRALLRLNLVDGLSIDEIAPLYGSHRSSVARWLAEAREALAAETRAQLQVRLRLEGDALESLLRSVQSRFELSLIGALR